MECKENLYFVEMCNVLQKEENIAETGNCPINYGVLEWRS